MDLVDPRDRTLSSDCWIDNQIKSFSSYPQQFVMPSPLIPLCPSFYQGHPGRKGPSPLKLNFGNHPSRPKKLTPDILTLLKLLSILNSTTVS